MIRELAEGILNSKPDIVLFIWLMMLPILLPMYAIRLIQIKMGIEPKDVFISSKKWEWT